MVMLSCVAGDNLLSGWSGFNLTFVLAGIREWFGNMEGMINDLLYDTMIIYHIRVGDLCPTSSWCRG